MIYYQQSGLRFFYDYVPYSFFEYEDLNLLDLYHLCEKENINDVLSALIGERQGCIIHGNCQTLGIIKYLNANKKFKEKHF